MSLELTKPAMRAPVVVALDGSDSAGLRGLQAIERACAALGAHVAPVATRLEAPPEHIWPIPAVVVEAQLMAALEHVGRDAVVTGAFGGVLGLEALCAALEDKERLALPLVVNPRLLDRQGRAQSPEELAPVMRQRLLRRAKVATLNQFEAQLLTRYRAHTQQGARDALKALFGMGVELPVLHSAPDAKHAVDLAYDGSGLVEFGADRLDQPAPGGGGLLAGAIAASLARGADGLSALEAAHGLLHEALRASAKAGDQEGVPVPMASLYQRADRRYDALLDEPLLDARGA